MKKIFSFILVLALVFAFTGCTSEEPAGEQPIEETEGTEETTILLAAAASLKNVMDDEIIPAFEDANPNIKVSATYDSSGKLQTQIEEGAEVDVFFSAALKQMDALNEQGLILEDSIVEVLENKIVLIVPEGKESNITNFEDVLNAENIAIGDPESVPAGQYAQEVFQSLNMWDEVLEKSSLGTNVTEVLNWVAEGSADVGVVYSTDAASNDGVSVIAEAPEGSVSKIIYPAGVIKASQNTEAAKSFVEFLQSEESAAFLESYGFSPIK